MSLSANVNEKAALIWAIADKLTGVYKPHEYGEVILPLTVIRRFDCVLADTKDVVLEKYEQVKNLPMKDILLRNVSGKAFYNTSKYTFEKLPTTLAEIETFFAQPVNATVPKQRIMSTNAITFAKLFFFVFIINTSFLKFLFL